MLKGWRVLQVAGVFKDSPASCVHIDGIGDNAVTPNKPRENMTPKQLKCRLDHDTMRREVLEKGITPPIECPECGETLVIR